MSIREANESFKTRCDEAFSVIKSARRLNYPIISDCIGEQIGVPGTTIEYWKRGYPPRSWEQLEKMAVSLLELSGTRLDESWLRGFLEDGLHPFVERGVARVAKETGREFIARPSLVGLPQVEVEEISGHFDSFDVAALQEDSLSTNMADNEQRYIVISQRIFIASLILHAIIVLTHPVFSPFLWLGGRKPDSDYDNLG